MAFWVPPRMKTPWSLGNLWQHSVSLTVNKCFFVFRCFSFAIACCPVTEHQWKEPGFLFFAHSFQTFIHIDEFPPGSFFSRVNISSSFNLSSYERCSSPLNILDGLSPVLRSPVLDTELQLWPHQCWVQKKVQIPWPDAALDTISLVCYKGTVLVHVPSPHSPSVQSCFQPVSPHHELVQDFALAELYEAPARPFLHPVEVPLKTSIILWWFSHSSQFWIIRVLAEGTILITNEDVQLDSYHQSPLTPSKPEHSASFQSNSVFAYLASLGEDRAKGLTESGADNIHCSLLLYWDSHFVIEGYQIG